MYLVDLEVCKKNYKLLVKLATGYANVDKKENGGVTWTVDNFSQIAAVVTKTKHCESVCKK